jgi:hypothetical protein
MDGQRIQGLFNSTSYKIKLLHKNHHKLQSEMYMYDLEGNSSQAILDLLWAV